MRVFTDNSVYLSTQQSRPLEAGLLDLTNILLTAGSGVSWLVSLQTKINKIAIGQNINAYPEKDEASGKNLQLTEGQMVLCEIFTIHHQILVKRRHFETLHQLMKSLSELKYNMTIQEGQQVLNKNSIE